MAVIVVSQYIMFPFTTKKLIFPSISFSYSLILCSGLWQHFSLWYFLYERVSVRHRPLRHSWRIASCILGEFKGTEMLLSTMNEWRYYDWVKYHRSSKTSCKNTEKFPMKYCGTIRWNCLCWIFRILDWEKEAGKNKLAIFWKALDGKDTESAEHIGD